MNFLRSFDWLTAIIYVILVLTGWCTINAASYNFDGASIFDFSRPSGKQIVWFGLALFLIVVILCIDVRTYMTYPPVIYLGIMLLLFATIFIGSNINGSHSWIKLGNFSIQPAEFGKFSTALMLAWLFNTYSFKFTRPANFIKACIIILLPVILIICQNETGSALVYFSLILLFYRMGMSGIVLWSGFCAIFIFVLAIKYSVNTITGETSDLGEVLCLMAIPNLIALMLAFYSKNKNSAWHVFLVSSIAFFVTWILRRFVPMPFIIKYQWVGWAVCAYCIGYCIWLFLMYKYKRYLTITFFSVCFIGFLYCVNYVFTNVLEDHQRGRIEVLLGIKEDPKGVGYNVIQAKIAIGSGGFFGKGYLEGTQTKLAYVPEQETDFIFCTVGEEEGFVGSTILILLYSILITRILYLAERQRTIFAQVYGYCVASIFAFHVIINIGMVIGLVPVIGIPLPFFSYGGSGLWSFTILLFIFLKLDAARIEKY